MSSSEGVMSSAGAGFVLTCALSGNPITCTSNDEEYVVTPSGYVCTKRLLSSKLSENGGIDPFVTSSSRPLSEEELIPLQLPSTSSCASSFSASVVPPRPSSATTFPSLLSLMQKEYDALLLELFDARKVLEETRKELSQALYQNDAAIRVVARLAMERDAAREQVRLLSSKIGGGGVVSEDDAAAEHGGMRKKRRRDETSDQQPQQQQEQQQEEQETQVGPKKPTQPTPAIVEPDAAAPSRSLLPSDKIPQQDLDVMIDKWKTLSKERRKKRTVPPTYSTFAQLSSFVEVDKKSLHKASSKPGVTCLAITQSSLLLLQQEHKESDTQQQQELTIIASGGNDKHVVLYNYTNGTILDTLSSGAAAAGGAMKEITCVDISQNGQIVVCGCKDGVARIYTVISSSPSTAEEDTANKYRYEFLGSVSVDVGNDDNDENKERAPNAPSSIVDVSIQPTGKYVLVASQSGKIAFCSITTATTFNTNDEKKTTRGVEKLAIFAPPTSIKAEVEEDETILQYTCCDIHPDGLIYGVGTNTGKILIWDLKSQSLAGTLEGHEGPVTCITFSNNGYHVASSSFESGVIVSDLRKLKNIITLNQKKKKKEDDSNEEDADDDVEYIGNVRVVKFDPSGKYLAYGSDKGITRVTVVKEWTNTVTYKGKGDKEGQVCDLIWGTDAKFLASCSDVERFIRFWGASTGKDEGVGEDSKDDKMEEDG